MYRFIRYLRSTIKGECAHTAGRSVQRLDTHTSSIPFDASILLHPQRRSFWANHPRGEQSNDVHRSLYRYWQLSSLELGIWVIGMLVALFSTLETSIYCTVALSFAILLVRLARTRGRFLGRVRTQLVYERKENEPEKSSPQESCVTGSRDAFLPMDKQDACNPQIEVNSPHPGVFVYRFSEGLNYTNHALYTETLHEYIMMEHTTRTQADDGVLAPATCLSDFDNSLTASGSPLVRPRPGPEHYILHAPNPARHSPRLLRREQRQHHLGAGLGGPPQRTRPARGASDSGMAVCGAAGPVGAPRAGRGRVRVPRRQGRAPAWELAVRVGGGDGVGGGRGGRGWEEEC